MYIVKHIESRLGENGVLVRKYAIEPTSHVFCCKESDKAPGLIEELKKIFPTLWKYDQDTHEIWFVCPYSVLVQAVEDILE